MSVCSIQLPQISREIPTPITFGTNARVTSWIWVIDWNTEITKPITRAGTRIGAESLRATSMVCIAMSMTALSVTGSPRIALDKRPDHQTPAVDEHEQQQPER